MLIRWGTYIGSAAGGAGVIYAAVTVPNLNSALLGVLLVLGSLALVVGFLGVGQEIVGVIRGRPEHRRADLLTAPHPKMQGQMALLHEEGLDKHDELRGLRDYRIESHTRAHYDEWFASWDARVYRFVIEGVGIQYWGQFGGDSGLAATDLSAFPEWVQEMATAVDRRLLRLRWIANGKVGLAP